jgi:hypothetical protein
MTTAYQCPFLNNEELITELLRLKCIDRKRKEICEDSEQEIRRIKTICSRSSQKLSEILKTLQVRYEIKADLLEEIKRVIENLSNY